MEKKKIAKKLKKINRKIRKMGKFNKRSWRFGYNVRWNDLPPYMKWAVIGGYFGWLSTALFIIFNVI